MSEQILVVWRDSISNYSKENEKQIEKAFKNKYGVDNVKVTFRPHSGVKSSDVTDIRVESNDNIYEQEYQKNLINKYLELNEMESDVNLLTRLDNKVEAELGFDKSSLVDKTFKVNWITLNNFLSFNDTDQTLPLSELHGVNAVVSNPANFGGKTTMSVDALLFLFFGKTTKTDKQEELFNLFTDTNKLKVSGSITVDGQEYIIERLLVKKQARDGSWAVKSKIDYKQPLPEGGYMTLNGEQRQETDKIIQQAVGTFDDFLLTIVATQRTLEDIIYTKPTERGRIFNRFVGLDYFEEKEKIAKKQYKAWKEKSLSNRYTIDGIQQEIENESQEISLYEQNKSNISGSITQIKDELTKLTNKRKELEAAIHNDVDTDLLKRTEEDIRKDINKLEVIVENKKRENRKFEQSVEEPKEVYDVNTFNGLSEELDEYTEEKNELTVNIRLDEGKLEQLNNYDTCPHCGEPLTEVNTDEIELLKQRIESNNKKLEDVNNAITEVKDELSELEKIKEEYTKYETALLTIDKNELELEKYELSLERGNTLLSRYLDNKQKIEENKLNLTSIQQIGFKIEGKQNDLNNKNMELGMVDSSIGNATRRLNDKREILTKINNETKVDKIFQDYIKLYGKNGISKMVLATLIPMINNYLSLLMGDILEYNLMLDLNDKNELEYLVVDKETKKVRKLKSTSGCELTVSALALRVVLGKICSLPKPNMVVFDEAFGKVADVNLSEIGSFLKRVKDYFDIILVTEHRQDFIFEYADNIITVQKNNKVSNLLINKD